MGAEVERPADPQSLPDGGRTMAAVGVAPIAWRLARRSASVPAPCSRSMISQSNPARATISVATGDAEIGNVPYSVSPAASRACRSTKPGGGVGRCVWSVMATMMAGHVGGRWRPAHVARAWAVRARRRRSPRNTFRMSSSWISAQTAHPCRLGADPRGTRQRSVRWGTTAGARVRRLRGERVRATRTLSRSRRCRVVPSCLR